MNHEEVAAVHRFMQQMLEIRDRLDPILKGEIERGHCLAGQAEAYGGVRGYRKTTLKDARAIAKHCKAFIDRAYDELDEYLIGK